MRTTAICAALAALVGPVVAQASCPVAADMATGVQIDFDDASHEIYDLLDGDLRVRQFFDDDDTVNVLIYAGGIVQKSYTEARFGGYGTKYSYDFDVDGVLPLKPGDKVTGTANSVDTDGVEEASAYSLEAGQIETVEIGDCSYQMMLVTETMVYPEGKYVYVLGFLPELGVNYIVTDTGPDYGPEEYQPVSISVVGQ